MSEERPQPRRPIVRAGGRVAIVVSQSLPEGVEWAWHDGDDGTWFFVSDDLAARIEARVNQRPAEDRPAAVARIRAALAAERRPRPGRP